ncbi:T9SS type B sorting domain-containing protein [Psychroflexus planctonicus]|uniref:T9SS C-terminal target domain-containing protein n=1 Tax=Psychroflexus planctonicus TaxID=1526575 RepID=A0ABQ1SD36_9FLAO|nr:T9SS type B sorting domain-containing protein [Psychroflexus planctonicus]GGE29586.1 T9SS C-terminal target domain-containing protein [Psychroflexus planctonicus]
MKQYFLFSFLFYCTWINAQFIEADHLAFSDQLLIEEVLFDNSDCVEDILITNTVSGEFPDGMKSYGYFTAPSNSSFPFQNGLVLSTGRLDNTEGPNNSLSDDDAENWGGDQDLRDALNIPDNELLTNATSISFNFTPKASQLSFQYIFASEEYQENNSNTCVFSDVFAFLIRPQGSQDYENIAVVPETTIPVKVTTVRPEIPNACPAENEEWFGQFNQSNGADAVSPTNFNGQTEVLTAIANVEPDQVYEVKLVIADEANYRYDSAVFINGGSFEVGVNLGLDRIDDRAICEGEEAILDVSEDNPTAVNWFYNGNLVEQNQNTLSVSENNYGAGTYAVEVTLENGCIATDEIIMDFQSNNQPEPFSLVTCGDANDTNLAYNLTEIESDVDNLQNNFSIQEFYLTEENAINQNNSIPNPETFSPNAQNNDVFVRLENIGGCQLIVPVILQNNAFQFDALSFTECPNPSEESLSYNTNQIRNAILNLISEQVEQVNIYPSNFDALQDTNRILSDNFSIDITDFPVTYYARLQNSSECEGLVPIEFNLVERPEFGNVQTDLTLCRQDEFLVLDPQITSENENIEYLWNTGETTPTIEVSEAGTYSLTASQTSQEDGEVISCSNEIEFNVDVSGIESLGIQIIGQPNQTQSAIIEAFPEGNYRYSLNSTSQFQSNNVFELNEVENVIYIQDLEGCGIVARSFTVIDFPEFFTPNNDGINDAWRPRGIRNESINLKRVQIFDRFGKLMISFGPGGKWDGTYNGKPMPPNDYWYKVSLSGGRVFTGNITLKR